ncbi:interferon omega-1-like isoform X1 [Rhincodon typus]|uniref:interferon omega-1-like isoform X1 n=1 Tax=Rhincodon typus TaxID=259920 RepID=UPI00202E38BC|nr:interferon omega-1-like isoform X1 [Rhincodon typus]XP_048470763.1 interferon omega-1-like isoform X2 [Rhincodon typus]XP_048470764.1 interferon omega-1-like isoform X1 [Rhincodon typus]
MALATIWRFWTVLVLVSGSLSLGCERLQLQQVLNTETLSKLHEMEGRFPWQCVRERSALKAKPLNLVKLSEGLQAQDKIQILHQTLRHIKKIYSMNLGSATWARDKVENVRLLLDRQFREVDECVKRSGTEARLSRNTTIHKYFRKLRKFLKQKNFNDCSWEISRTETRARLQQLFVIMAQVGRRN